MAGSKVVSEWAGSVVRVLQLAANETAQYHHNKLQLRRPDNIHLIRNTLYVYTSPFLQSYLFSQHILHAGAISFSGRNSIHAQNEKQGFSSAVVKFDNLEWPG